MGYYPNQDELTPAEEKKYKHYHKVNLWNYIDNNLNRILYESREKLLDDQKLDSETVEEINRLLEKLEGLFFENGTYASREDKKENRTKNKKSEKMIREGKDVLYGDNQIKTKGKLLKTMKAKIKRIQVRHRKEKLARVINYYANRLNFKEVERVAQVDANKPIIEQLGYDPDDKKYVKK